MHLRSGLCTGPAPAAAGGAGAALGAAALASSGSAAAGGGAAAAAPAASPAGPILFGEGSVDGADVDGDAESSGDDDVVTLDEALGAILADLGMDDPSPPTAVADATLRDTEPAAAAGLDAAAAMAVAVAAQARYDSSRALRDETFSGAQFRARGMAGPLGMLRASVFAGLSVEGLDYFRDEFAKMTDAQLLSLRELPSLTALRRDGLALAGGAGLKPPEAIAAGTFEGKSVPVARLDLRSSILMALRDKRNPCDTFAPVRDSTYSYEQMPGRVGLFYDSPNGQTAVRRIFEYSRDSPEFLAGDAAAKKMGFKGLAIFPFLLMSAFDGVAVANKHIESEMHYWLARSYASPMANHSSTVFASGYGTSPAIGKSSKAETDNAYRSLGTQLQELVFNPIHAWARAGPLDLPWHEICGIHRSYEGYLVRVEPAYALPLSDGGASWIWNGCAMNAVCNQCTIASKDFRDKTAHGPHNYGYIWGLWNRYDAALKAHAAAAKALKAAEAAGGNGGELTTRKQETRRLQKVCVTLRKELTALGQSPTVLMPVWVSQRLEGTHRVPPAASLPGSMPIEPLHVLLEGWFVLAVSFVIRLVLRSRGVVVQKRKGKDVEAARPGGTEAMRSLSSRLAALPSFALFVDSVEYQRIVRGIAADTSLLTGRGTRSVVAGLFRTLTAEDLPDEGQLKHALVVLGSLLVIEAIARARINELSIDFVEQHVSPILAELEASWDAIFSGSAFTTTDNARPKHHALLRHFVPGLLGCGAASQWTCSLVEAAHKEYAKWSFLLTNGRDDDHTQQATAAFLRQVVRTTFPLFLKESPKPYVEPPSPDVSIVGEPDAPTKTRVAAFFAARGGAAPARLATTLHRQTMLQTCPTYTGDVVFLADKSHARVVAFAELQGELVALVVRLVAAGAPGRRHMWRMRDPAPDEEQPIVLVPVSRMGRKVHATDFPNDAGGRPTFLVSSTGFLP